ncbi:MAG: glycosyltransferase family 4 protein [Acidobacteriota bacterium]
MVAFALAVFFSLILNPVARYLAVKGGWQSHSANRKGLHPAMSGGVAVLLTLTAALLLAAGTALFANLLPYWIGTAMLFAMGLVDDWVVLSPRTKLGCQVLAVSVFLALMIRQEQLAVSFWLPLFFLWLLGVTNSLNLLDNMDGLAAGVGATAALTLALIEPGWTSSLSSLSDSSLVLLALSGSLLGFLVYNFHPARIFLGDSGSHLVGFTLAALPFYSLDAVDPGSDWRQLLVPPLVLLVPITDTIFVTFTRLRRRAPVSQGGKDHLSHRLAARGCPEWAVAILFYLAAAVAAGIALAVFAARL